MRSLALALRLQIFLYLVVAVLGAAAVGLVVSAGGRGLFLAALLLAAAVLLSLALLLLDRALVRPLARLVHALEAMGRLDPEGPLLAESASMSALIIGVERLAARLVAERERTSDAIDELTAVNRELTRARDELVRTEKLATVGTLAAGVAHEVGNPLGAVLGYVDLARKKPAQAGELLARIETEARRIDHIVRELLDFSKPRELQIGPVSLQSAAQSALSLVKMQRRFGAVEVQNEIAPDVPPVRADERRIVQVLVNLLINAADAMGGQGRVTLTTEVHGDKVALCVTDGGPGVPKEIAGRLFEPFVTTKPPGSGTGLGLAICARIMEECGGVITAEQPPAGGARFRLGFRAWVSTVSAA